MWWDAGLSSPRKYQLVEMFKVFCLVMNLCALVEVGSVSACKW